MAGFMPMKEKPRYHFLRVVKDWETGTAYRGGDLITLSGAETQAFLRLLRWAEAAGRGGRPRGGWFASPHPPRAGGNGPLGRGKGAGAGPEADRGAPPFPI